MKFNFLLSCRNDTKEDVFVHQVRFPWNWNIFSLRNCLFLTHLSRIEVVEEPCLFTVT